MEDTTNWKDFPYPWVRKINTVKNVSLLKAVDRSKVITKILMVFYRNRKKILNSHGSTKESE